MVMSDDYQPLKIEQVTWADQREALLAIRRRVFIEEQQVPEHLEIDGKDELPDTQHWQVTDTGGLTLATARVLAGGKVGRVAVLAAHRGRDIGKQLMIAIIRQATRDRLYALKLSSQCSAVPFYQKLGFDVISGEYMDAGIPHVDMELLLARFSHPSEEDDLSPIADADRERTELHGDDQFAAAAISLFAATSRSVRLYSSAFDNAWLHNPAVAEAAASWLTRSRDTKLFMLTNTDNRLSDFPQPLVRLIDRLSSHCFLRAVPPQTSFKHPDFILGDDTRLVMQQETRAVGYRCLHSPQQGRMLRLDFDETWEQSAPIWERRRLTI